MTQGLEKPENAPDASSAISDACNLAIKIGNKDESGQAITYIYSKTKKYIIYESDKQLRYVLPEDYQTARMLRSKIQGLGGLRSSIESMRSNLCLGISEARRAGLEMAWAIGLGFDDATAATADQGKEISDLPKEILTRIDERLHSLLKSHFRKTYAFANLQAFAGIALFFMLFAMALNGKTSPTEVALQHYAAFGMFGALGAFLSVLIGIRSVEIDINLGPWEHIFAGATRIMIGVIGAWIVGLALDSNFIDPTFGHKDASTAGSNPMGFDPRTALYFIFTFIGGFSQTLVPSLLKRGEEAAETGQRATQPTGPIVKTMKP